jgi:hypothetical protein
MTLIEHFSGKKNVKLLHDCDCLAAYTFNIKSNTKLYFAYYAYTCKKTHNEYWIFIKTTKAIMAAMRKNKISVRNVFLKSSSVCYLVNATNAEDPREVQQTTFKKLDSKGYIPKDDVYFSKTTKK